MGEALMEPWAVMAGSGEIYAVLDGGPDYGFKLRFTGLDQSALGRLRVIKYGNKRR